MSNLVTRTLTVNASHRDQAAALCACLPSGEGMFTRAYGTVDDETDEQTIVGYISHGPILTTYASWVETSDTAAIVAAAAQAGLTVTEGEVADVLDHSMCSEQDPHQWLAEQGYVLL